VPQDDAEAVKWYRKAADQGSAAAQNHLGLMYDNGRGVPQDDAEAVKWYRKAADQGDARAQNNLGTMYETGRGVPKDRTRALRHYRAAAALGSKPAQQNLSRLDAQLFDVAGVQRLLASLGYDPGPVDGAMGRRTRDAIAAFQRDHSLTGPAEPSAGLIVELFKALFTAKDTTQSLTAEPPAAPASPPPAATIEGLELIE
jgi:peptidoglycan hydrolase-like protein with peptidoglycan-binding domain